MSPDELRQVGIALYGAKWTAELACRLDVQPNTIRRWLKSKHVPPRNLPFKLLNLCKTRRTELDLAASMLRSHTITCTPSQARRPKKDPNNDCDHAQQNTR